MRMISSRESRNCACQAIFHRPGNYRSGNKLAVGIISVAHLRDGDFTQIDPAFSASVKVCQNICMSLGLSLRVSPPPLYSPCHYHLWSRITKNPDLSTMLLVRSLVCSHCSLIRLLHIARFALLASLARSAALTHLLAHSLTRSLPRSWESELFDGYFFCIFFFIVHVRKSNPHPDTRIHLKCHFADEIR